MKGPKKAASLVEKKFALLSAFFRFWEGLFSPRQDGRKVGRSRGWKKGKRERGRIYFDLLKKAFRDSLSLFLRMKKKKKSSRKEIQQERNFYTFSFFAAAASIRKKARIPFTFSSL